MPCDRDVEHNAWLRDKCVPQLTPSQDVQRNGKTTHFKLVS